MNRNRTAGIAFVVMGVSFLGLYFLGDRGVVWLALGVVFILLGSARMRRGAGT